MRNLKKFTVKLLVAFIIVATFFTTFSYAEENVTSEDSNTIIETTSTEDQTTTDTTTSSSLTSSVKKGDLFLTGDSITIDYDVSGNVFIIANEVTIDHNIDGNVFILANKINIDTNAYIYSDLFACASEITISGTIYDVYSVSNKLILNPSMYIVRDITASTSSLSLSGYVRRNANFNFSTIQINESYTLIEGDLNYSASTESIPDSIVSGSINYTEAVSSDTTETNAIIKNYLQEFLQVLVVAIIIIVIVVIAASKFTNKMYCVLSSKAAATLGCGALTLILVPVICFVLFCTIVGIIPALALLFTYIFILSISPIILSIPLAKIICNKMNKESKGLTILFALLIVIVIWLLEQIPILGMLVTLFVSLFGLGIVTYSIFRPTPKKKDNVVAKASAVIGEVENKKDKTEKKDKKEKSNKKDKKDK